MLLYVGFSLRRHGSKARSCSSPCALSFAYRYDRRNRQIDGSCIYFVYRIHSTSTTTDHHRTDITTGQETTCLVPAAAVFGESCRASLRASSDLFMAAYLARASLCTLSRAQRGAPEICCHQQGCRRTRQGSTGRLGKRLLVAEGVWLLADDMPARRSGATTRKKLGRVNQFKFFFFFFKSGGWEKVKLNLPV